MDKVEFFREATLRICSTLKIEKALKSCLQYISQYIPANKIYLERYETELAAIRMIAFATPEKGESVDILIQLAESSKNAMSILFEAFTSGELPKVIIINDPSKEPVTKELTQLLGLPLSSVLSLPLIVEDELIGSLSVFAEGNNQYTSFHAELLELLREPFSIAMSNTLEHREVLKYRDFLADDNKYLHGELRRMSGSDVIGGNFGLKEVMRKVQQVASLDSPVLLLGETGVGKDVIANVIHYSSSRSSGPFVSVNCGAIPETLIDSELFGHEKGAFTGALNKKKGKFERANKGTIFLDEIGELPPHAQIRLLRVIQNKEIERVGGFETINLDIRIIAATNRNLEQMVKDEKFREDLWFRLNVFPILIPPLRNRLSDVPSLVQFFIKQKAKELKLPAIPTLAGDVIDMLLDYHWPGNVRELQNVIERALILNPSGPLVIDNLIIPTSIKNTRNTVKDYEEENLDKVISNHIIKILNKANGRIHGPGGAADLMGINPSTLRNRIRKLGINFKMI